MKPALDHRFFGALQFLTVLPVASATAAPGDAAVFFPLVGAIIGVSAGLVGYASGLFFNRSIGALLAVVWLVWISGSLHEDGLADIADAVRAGRSRERMMEILKDSRIGVYGAAALIASLSLRWQAIASQPPGRLIAGLGTAVGLSRAALVFAAAWSPGLNSNLASGFKMGCDRGTVIAVTGQSLLIVAGFGLVISWGRAAAAAVAAAAALIAARAWLLRRLGGLNGDALGATCQAVEISALLVMAWHPYG